MTEITNFNKSTPKLCGVYLIILLPPKKEDCLVKCVPYGSESKWKGSSNETDNYNLKKKSIYTYTYLLVVQW